MKHMPANVTYEHASGPGRVIGLFLERLLACLLRLRASGETVAPAYIAHMVNSTDDMVHAYICNLAAMRLKRAGYAHAARALRTTRADRAPTINAEPASPEELIARLETTISTFDEAEALSAHFARLVFCALCVIATDERGPIFPIAATLAQRRAAVERAMARQYVATAGRGPPAFSPTIPNLVWDPRQSAGKMPGLKSRAWIPAYAGIFG